ncbi:MAG: S-layer homology domain-containing protein [Selenomonadaceae bacterium]|nr:S-layer homology domain-containing protein [Selenomonadaceae bacterium]
MKKTVAAAVAAAFVVGTASTSFAAANPFSDVPAGHWAYQSVAKLASLGVVEGYGDGTYRGDRNITRYEMAQMVAKAMAKNPGGVGKAELDRLAAEFRDELDALGVRVAELEKYADKVVWHGKIEYTYKSARTDNVYNNGKTKVNMDDWIFRFEPVAHVNDHWTLRARIDAHADLSRNNSGKFSLERGWAQGDYNKFQVIVGKAPLYTNEDGIVWDTEYSGGEITVGSKWKFRGIGGRLAAGTAGGSLRNSGSWNGRQDDVSAHARWGAAAGSEGLWSESGLRNDPSSFWAVNVQYDQGEKGIFGGAGYYSVRDDDFKTTAYSKSGQQNQAKIWSANLGYRFSDKARLWGAYAKNQKADYENRSWQALFQYGNLYGGGGAAPVAKGRWSVWAGYKELGSNSSLCAINWDDCYAGTKGVVAGFSVAPMDNVVFLAKYFKGKYITGKGDAERLFGRVELFF